MTVRVLIVEDSLTVRKMLAEVLSATEEFEVVGESADGRDAIEKCEKLRPDVITMDMMMPVMTGLSATEYIMAYFPTPILILSASVNRSGALKTLDALAAGAIDIFDKPDGTEPDADWVAKFLRALKMASRIRPIPHPRAKLRGARPAWVQSRAVISAGARAYTGEYEVLAIGTSTGGPNALMELLPMLPADFDLPILLVLHIDERFDVSFREWLASVTKLRIEPAQHNMPLPKRGDRRIIIPEAGQHLELKGDRLQLTDAPERHSCRPSIDVLFESLAEHRGRRAIGCLLTGMGRDGAAGLLAMKNSGALTIAQDEASSIIHGMPGEAIRLGAACRVLPLDMMAGTLGNLSRGQGGKS